MYNIKQISIITVFTMRLFLCLLIVIGDFNDIEATQSTSGNVRPSDQKCREYIEAMQTRQQMKDRSNNEERLRYPKSQNRYVRRKYVNRKDVRFGVHGGRRTRPTEYPHMGALGWYSFIKRDWDFQCGASLISSNFLLTAAHCTKIVDRFNIYTTSQPKIVRLGARNIRKSSNEMYHDYKIDEIKVHKKYMSPNNYFDIALLKLSREVKFTKFIHPACLQTDLLSRKTASNQIYTVTGWGIVARAGEMVDDLRYGMVDLIDQKKCDLYVYPYRNRNWNMTAPHQICAGKMDGSVDTCNGDSGGPLQYNLTSTKDEGTMHVIIGITAFGSTKCATKYLPSLYTKVQYFITWIENIVWPKEATAFYNTYVQNKKKSLHGKRYFKNNF